MFTKRIIPCLDVKDGRVVKGVNFVDLRDAGDPVEIAAAYDKAGADEVVFLDITTSSDHRNTVVDMVRRVAEQVFIPFTVGGGIRTVDDFKALLREHRHLPQPDAVGGAPGGQDARALPQPGKKERQRETADRVKKKACRNPAGLFSTIAQHSAPRQSPASQVAGWRRNRIRSAPRSRRSWCGISRRYTCRRCAPRW